MPISVDPILEEKPISNRLVQSLRSEIAKADMRILDRRTGRVIRDERERQIFTRLAIVSAQILMEQHYETE